MLAIGYTGDAHNRDLSSCAVLWLWMFSLVVCGLVFIVEWDLRKINQQKFVTCIHVRVVPQTVVSMKHDTATIAVLRMQLPNSKGPHLFLI